MAEDPLAPGGEGAAGNADGVNTQMPDDATAALNNPATRVMSDDGRGAGQAGSSWQPLNDTAAQANSPFPRIASNEAFPPAPPEAFQQHGAQPQPWMSGAPGGGSTANRPNAASMPPGAGGFPPGVASVGTSGPAQSHGGQPYAPAGVGASSAGNATGASLTRASAAALIVGAVLALISPWLPWASMTDGVETASVNGMGSNSLSSGSNLAQMKISDGYGALILGPALLAAGVLGVASKLKPLLLLAAGLTGGIALTALTAIEFSGLKSVADNDGTAYIVTVGVGLWVLVLSLVSAVAGGGLGWLAHRTLRQSSSPSPTPPAAPASGYSSTPSARGSSNGW